MRANGREGMRATMPDWQTADSGGGPVKMPAKAGRRFDICVPVYCYDATPLISALAQLDDAAHIGLCVYDDGSNDPALTEALRAALADYPGPTSLISAPENRGRSAARNALIDAAVAEWLLFLDADMLPDAPDFITRYEKAIATAAGPALIVGGFSLKQVSPDAATRLHAAQSASAECLPAAIRTKRPGAFVFTSNLLVHRDILSKFEFCPEFAGWGWEDVDWGLRVGREFPIIHIDNSATHLGLDTETVLLRKYGSSTGNFARVVARHPEAVKVMPVYRAARALKRLPARGAVIGAARWAASPAGRFLPLAVRLYALKIYRAALYASVL